MIFRFAIKDKYIKDSPSAGAIIPAKMLTVEDIEKNQIEESYFEEAELTEFLKTVQDYGLDFDLERFYLLAFSGMRVGELCDLKWPDINFEDNQVRITKTLYNPDNNQFKYELTPPKTPAAIRTVEINDSVMELLSKLMDRMKVIFGEDKIGDCFVFSRENGTPFIPGNVNKRMQRLLDKTSIKKKAPPHIFRHTHISMLTEAGVDLATFMQRAGHDDKETTMKIYTHVTTKMKKYANEKIKKHFASLLNI